MKEIILAFYGDDFTGSTDALEFITNAGANAMLFIEPPTKETLAKYPELNVIGVAGKTRALPPKEMEDVLMKDFEAIKNIQPKFVHYKVCSTFDSAPHIGSIGKAIDCGLQVFKNKLVPVIGGAPHLGRYCVFGNLFAQMGIGSDGQIYRLDRHPSMSKHPVTPATESDLCLHLQKQTNKKIGLIDWIFQKGDFYNWEYETKGLDVALLDTLTNGQLYGIAKWFYQLQQQANPLFIVGPSSVEVAFGKYWKANHFILPLKKKFYKKRIRCLVVSGSCSPITKKQIEVALENNFGELVLDAVSICNDEKINDSFYEKLEEILKRKNKVIVHTGDKQTNNLPSEILGTALGLIAKYAVENCGIKRVVVAGGDTSSYAARAMEIEAVEMIASSYYGAPLCKAFSKNERMNGIEVNFKGGQVGGENYFTNY